MTVYEPGQVREIYPYLDFKPDWFLLGGPADATEAQDMRSRYPHIAIIGFEPNPLFYNLQRARGFPGMLVPCALWDERKTIDLSFVPHADGFWQEQRSTSLMKFENHPHKRRNFTVEARTLDDLSDEFGPFQDAVLWIDIEEAELECLRGARRLLEAGAIRLINAEILKEDMDPIVSLLRNYGIREVGRWNINTHIVDADDGSKVVRAWANVIFRRD